MSRFCLLLGSLPDKVLFSSPSTVYPQVMGSGEGTNQQQSLFSSAQLSSGKKCGMCGQYLPFSMFAKGQGYQTRCAPCRVKHNASHKASAEKRKGDDARDEATGRRVFRTCGQSLDLQLYFGGKGEIRGEKYYTKCFACRGEAEMKKGGEEVKD